MFNLAPVKSAYEAFLPNPFLVGLYILGIIDRCFLVFILLYGNVTYYFQVRHKYKAQYFNTSRVFLNYIPYFMVKNNFGLQDTWTFLLSSGDLKM